jgi:5-methylcytosine-specific restriction endonuclease McrA
MSFRALVEKIVHFELQQLIENSTNDSLQHVAKYIDWLKLLRSPQEIPTGWRHTRLKKEKIGKRCAFCDEKTLAGVEHIIPRSLGGPKFEKWNLAWSCYPCNRARESEIGNPNRPVPMNGWLGQQLSKHDLPSAKEVARYFAMKNSADNTIKEQEVGTETSEPLYHVTYFNRLENISHKGLVPGSGRSIGGAAYDVHAAQGIFLTEGDGISFWYGKAEDFAEHNSDNILEDGLVPVVLKIDYEGLKSDLQSDEPGTDDSRSEAYIHTGPIEPEYLEVWDGSSWIPVEDYWDIDIEQALDKEEMEDEDGNEEEYYLFKYSNENPLMPQ